MRLHRFYISEKIGTRAEVTVESAELANQIGRVFRLKTGDSVILFDGSGSDYECKLGAPLSGEHSETSKKKSGNNSVTFHIVSARHSSYMPKSEVILCAAITKKDTFEWIVQKATELGVTKIIPIMAERSEKKALNAERLNKIAIEASEQSGRGDVPVVSPIMALKDVVTGNNVGDEKIEITKCDLNPADMTCVALHVDAPTISKSEIVQLNATENPLALFIGPEGGWSGDEIALFHKQKIQVFSLGKQVLRAETAVVATLSLVLLGN